MTYQPRMPWLAEPIAKMSDRDRAELDRIDGLSTKIGNQIRQSFLDAVRNLGEKLDLRGIADYLQAGRVADAIGLVDAQLVADGLVPLSAAITSATIAAGQSAVTAMRAAPELSGTDFAFGITNPSTVEYLRSYEMNLIRELTVDALGSVRQAIIQGVNDGRNPINVARDVRGFIGLTARQTQAVQNFRRALENQQGDALDRALRDKRFDATVARSIRDQKPLSRAQVDRMTERYQARYLQYRAQTISRTESLRAVNAGNDMAWRQAVAGGKIAEAAVRRKWIYTADSKTRHAHRTIPFLNPPDGVGLNEPFKSEEGYIMRPGDPAAPASMTINCRCTVFLRFKASV